MNIKTLIAAAAAVLVAVPAMAQEARVFNDTIGTPKTRAEVKAELSAHQQAVRDGTVTGLVTLGDANVFVDAPVANVRNRAAVSGEARMAVRGDANLDAGNVVRQNAGEATIFVDGPVAGARSREDVRAEARQAIRTPGPSFPRLSEPSTSRPAPCAEPVKTQKAALEAAFCMPGT